MEVSGTCVHCMSNVHGLHAKLCWLMCDGWQMSRGEGGTVSMGDASGWANPQSGRCICVYVLPWIAELCWLVCGGWQMGRGKPFDGCSSSVVGFLWP